MNLLPRLEKGFGFTGSGLREDETLARTNFLSLPKIVGFQSGKNLHAGREGLTQGDGGQATGITFFGDRGEED